MNLFILRHGIAEDPGPKNRFTDADRALTREGELKLRQTAKAVRRLEVSFDLILSSPYRRAKDTAAIIAAALKVGKAVELSDTLAPGGSTRKLVEYLRHLPPSVDNVLLVGHEPYLSDLVSLLVFGEKASAVVLKKGGCCKMSAAALRHGRCASLEWLLTPKQLQLMS